MNLVAYGGDVALVSVTGPSLPWDRSRCSHPQDGRACSGKHGCRALPRYAMTWNRSAPRRWRELHRAAAQIARRRHGRLSVLARCWEYQRRGVLHMHVVLGMGSACEMAAAHTYVQALDELRELHGFGYVDRGRRRGGSRHLEVIEGVRAGRYLAKYLAPIAGAKLTLSETVLRRDVPPLVVWISPKLTTRTGCTMRFLRWVRLAHVLGVNPVTGELRESEAVNAQRLLAGSDALAHAPPLGVRAPASA